MQRKCLNRRQRELLSTAFSSAQSDNFSCEQFSHTTRATRESGPVRANGGVEAVVCDEKALDGTAADEVFADDLGNIFDLDPTVPDGFRVDDDGWAMLALLKASGLVDADAGDETGSLCSVLEGRVELTLAVGGAGTARTARLANIGTDEDVALEFRQSGLLRNEGSISSLREYSFGFLREFSLAL